MSISPFIRSPFSDITGGMVSHQILGRCARHEMEMAECMESYGLYRGRVKCQGLVEDFRQCATNILSYKRFIAMRNERDRQIACGMLTGDKKYVSPRVDAY